MLNITKISINSNLQLVGEELNRAVEATLEAIGLYVQSEAKARAPVGQYNDGRVGGNLRSSIYYEVDQQKKTVFVGTDVHYAQFVETGTSKMAAQPYLVPAAEENISNLNRLAKSTFEQFGR